MTALERREYMRQYRTVARASKTARLQFPRLCMTCRRTLQPRHFYPEQEWQHCRDCMRRKVREAVQRALPTRRPRGKTVYEGRGRVA